MRTRHLLLLSCLAQAHAFAFVPSLSATRNRCSVARCSQGTGALRTPTGQAPGFLRNNQIRRGDETLLRMGGSDNEKKQGELLNSLLLQRSIQTQVQHPPTYAPPRRSSTYPLSDVRVTVRYLRMHAPLAALLLRGIQGRFQEAVAGGCPEPPYHFRAFFPPPSHFRASRLPASCTLSV